MDHPVIAASSRGHHLPPAFHTRDFHYQFQQLHYQFVLQPKSEDINNDEASKNIINGNNNNNNNNNSDGVDKASNNKDLISIPFNSAGDSEITGRPRGRLAGSKPKPPITITRDSANALRSHMMDMASGCDISDSLSTFTRRGQRGVFVLNGSGTVTDVTLHQPASPAPSYPSTASSKSSPSPAPSYHLQSHRSLRG